MAALRSGGVEEEVDDMIFVEGSIANGRGVKKSASMIRLRLAVFR